ncbi:MAG: TIM barrel protein [Planctomycetota bacterium]|nr:TIM barrel protein [Planctomycetota bacterium]
MSSFRQSVAWWCVQSKTNDPAHLMRKIRAIGYQGVELLPPELWETARQAGLTVTSDSVPPIEKGLNRKEHHAAVEAEFRVRAERAAKLGVPNVIVFSGNRDGLDDEAGCLATIEGLKRLAPIAEKTGVTAILELLNSKVDHKDYQCDHTAWAARAIEAVGSPKVKVLYDIYHMQIMEGDLVATIRRHIKTIGHVHTAGVPGRFDLHGPLQEINYPAVMQGLKEAGYTGWVTQEFMPKGDAVESLEKAFALCSV